MLNRNINFNSIVPAIKKAISIKRAVMSIIGDNYRSINMYRHR